MKFYLIYKSYQYEGDSVWDSILVETEKEAIQYCREKNKEFHGSFKYKEIYVLKKIDDL